MVEGVQEADEGRGRPRRGVRACLPAHQLLQRLRRLRERRGVRRALRGVRLHGEPHRRVLRGELRRVRPGQRQRLRLLWQVNRTGAFCNVYGSFVLPGNRSLEFEEDEGLSPVLVNSGVLAVAGCCVLLVGAAWADDKGGYAGYVFVFIWLPAGVCLICVAVVVLIVGALAAQL